MRRRRRERTPAPDLGAGGARRGAARLRRIGVVVEMGCDRVGQVGEPVCDVPHRHVITRPGRSPLWSTPAASLLSLTVRARRRSY